MFSGNPFADLAERLDKIEARQAETLQLLRSTATTPAYADENPVSTDEAAKRFGIAKQTLYQNAKKIKHTKRFGRLYFYPSDLLAYLNNGSCETSPRNNADPEQHIPLNSRSGGRVSL